MEQTYIILDLNVSTDQDAAKAFRPAVCPFHHLASRLEADLPLDRLRFFLLGRNM